MIRKILQILKEITAGVEEAMLLGVGEEAFHEMTEGMFQVEEEAIRSKKDMLPKVGEEALSAAAAAERMLSSIQTDSIPRLG